MKRIIPVLLFTLVLVDIKAQQKKETIRFAGTISIGYIKGELQKEMTIETVNGIKYKTWFAGIGAAYDKYGYTSIPVFLEIRKYFGHENSWQPFVYVDGGFNISPHSRDLPKKLNDRDITRFNPSFYGEAGIGLSKKISKKLCFNFFGGYSDKKFSYVAYNYWGTMAPADKTYSYDYHYRRIVLRAGFEF